MLSCHHQLAVAAGFSILATGNAWCDQAAWCDEAAWGDLSGQFIYDGDPPAAQSIPVTKDADYLPATVPDESLLVDPVTRGVANILIYRVPDKTELRVHPSYEESAQAKVAIAMMRGRFNPHVLLLRTTQTMVQRTADDIAYSPRMILLANPQK